MNPQDSAYPLQTGCVMKDLQASPPVDTSSVVNLFEGGMSRRELIAAMALQGLLANPALTGVQNSATYMKLAFGMADAFLMKSATGVSEIVPDNVTPTN